MASTADHPLVFVDLDRCLLIDDSLGAFLTHLIELGLAPRSSFVRGALAYLAYRMNWADPESMVHNGVANMAGYREDDIAGAAESFFQDIAKFRYRPSVLLEIDQHRDAGHPVYLLTGGLPYVPRRIAAHLGLDGTCATVAEVVDGRFTGKIEAPPCVGAGKIVHAQRVAQDHGTTLARTWFYTDSYTDLPMLLVAETPVAVNPDGKLRRAARERGWRILGHR